MWTTKRLLSMALIGLWLLPALGVGGLSLHLAVDHHGSHLHGVQHSPADQQAGDHASEEPREAQTSHRHVHGVSAHPGSHPHDHQRPGSHSHDHEHSGSKAADSKGVDPEKPGSEHRGHDHGESSSSDHAELAAVLAEIASHGHHHEEAESSDHSHQAMFTASLVPDKTSLPTAWTLPTAAVVVPVAAEEVAFLTTAPRRGPPTPLFTSNCSLLI